MYSRVTIMIAAAFWAMALSAQTPPLRFPGVPQFTVTPQAPLVLRQVLKVPSLEKAAVCSIPLLEVPVPKNLEQMPTLRPPADNIDHMPMVKLPAPPCEEDKR